MLFTSPEDAWESLRSVGYITDMKTASTVYLACYLNKPILLEGLAGAGKTELAMALSRARNLDVIRLQCYDGITSKQVIGEINENLQNLYLKVSNLPPMELGSPQWQELVKIFTSRAFYRPGPLLRAFESDVDCLLLIDEIDKVDNAIEGMLLEALSAWTISVPEFGTIKAKRIPPTIITSNAERTLGNALRRRSLYLRVEFPTPEEEAAIVALKTPELDPIVHRYIAALAQEMRNQKFDKQPSIAEMVDIAKTMSVLLMSELNVQDQDVMMPLFCKTERDVQRLLGRSGAWADIVVGTYKRFMLAERTRITTTQTGGHTAIIGLSYESNDGCVEV